MKFFEICAYLLSHLEFNLFTNLSKKNYMTNKTMCAIPAAFYQGGLKVKPRAL